MDFEFVQHLHGIELIYPPNKLPNSLQSITMNLILRKQHAQKKASKGLNITWRKLYENEHIDVHSQSPLQAIINQLGWKIELETNISLWCNNICSIFVTNCSKYITKTLEKNYSKIIEIYSLAMVGIDHNQRKRSRKHEYKCSKTTSTRILIWLALTIAKESL
jgi:hypothetical protein